MRLGRAATRLLKDALERGGLDVRRRRADFHYAPDYYGRSFAQRSDIRATPVFGELAAQTIAEGRSCLYYDRLYVLFQALENLARYAGPLRIVEVGVYKGGTTAFLARTAQKLGIAAEVHAFDTFEGHAAVDVDAARDSIHRPGHFSDTSIDGVRQYLAPLSGITLHQGRFADRCGDLGDAALHLMHLDVDLYAPTLHGLELADERLIPGGICIVDDYQTRNCPGVIEAIDEFLARHPRYTVIHPLTEQCMLVKVGTR
jgi:hypothetical protein